MGLTSLGRERSSASVRPSSSSSGGSGPVGGGCCHTMASWACSLRYRLVRWVRLTLLTTFLGDGKGRVGGKAASRGAKAGRGREGPGRRRSPPAAGTGGATPQQGGLAALGAQQCVLLVLQLQQPGPHRLVPAHV